MIKKTPGLLHLIYTSFNTISYKCCAKVISGRSPINTSCSFAERICLVLLSVSISYTTNLKFAFKAADKINFFVYSITSNFGFSNLYEIYSNMVIISIFNRKNTFKTLSIPLDKSLNCSFNDLD